MGTLLPDPSLCRQTLAQFSYKTYRICRTYILLIQMEIRADGEGTKSQIFNFFTILKNNILLSKHFEQILCVLLFGL